MENLAKVHLSSVQKAFRVNGRSLPVLESIDFFALEGEFVSIIGPSGCGKSTLLNIMAGLEEPDAGVIELDGKPVSRRLGLVGHMPQKDLLMPWRTVLDNAALSLQLQGVPRNAARKRALELTEPFGLRGFENQYPFTLSGGMRQRAAFLRTILAGQEVILLDEPFGALDALTRTQMQEWLLNLWESLSKTIVLVTHDVEEAVLLSDRVYVLTPRPGGVRLVQTIDLPRPRRYSMVTQDPFVKLKTQLLSALRVENLKASEVSAL